MSAFRVIRLAAGPAWPVVRALRTRRHQARARRAWTEWLGGFTRAGVRLHPSVEFAGLEPFGRVTLGPACDVERDVTVWLSHYAGADARLTVGTNVFVGRNTYLGVHAAVSIGSQSMVGAYCYLVSGNHGYADRSRPMRDQGMTGGPVTLGEDVWLGTHVVVLPGVSIGRGAIVAAGSVVNKDVPAFQIWGGTPARFLRDRP